MNAPHRDLMTPSGGADVTHTLRRDEAMVANPATGQCRVGPPGRLAIAEDGVDSTRGSDLDHPGMMETPLAPGGNGLGIGLAVAKRLVELQDGTISVRSEGAGRGSEFIVTLPLVPPTA